MQIPSVGAGDLVDVPLPSVETATVGGTDTANTGESHLVAGVSLGQAVQMPGCVAIADFEPGV